MKYSVNFNKFKNIDTEEKAYWLGFIWCDGYNAIRFRNGEESKPQYEFKLSLAEEDVEHLEKFKVFLDSTHPIKKYKGHGFVNGQDEVSYRLSNNKFGKMLDEKYGLIPNRKSVEKLIKSIPKELERHFIRGVLDADGSFSHYNITSKEGYVCNKYSLSFTTYKDLIKYISGTLYENKISKSLIDNFYKRHKESDGECLGLAYSGRINVLNILNFLYKDATIYLDRKYLKYIEIKNKQK